MLATRTLRARRRSAFFFFAFFFVYDATSFQPRTIMSATRPPREQAKAAVPPRRPYAESHVCAFFSRACAVHHLRCEVRRRFLHFLLRLQLTLAVAEVMPRRAQEMPVTFQRTARAYAANAPKSR